MGFKRIVTETIPSRRTTWIFTLSETDRGELVVLIQRVGKRVQQMAFDIRELNDVIPMLQKLLMFKNSRKAGRRSK